MALKDSIKKLSQSIGLISKSESSSESDTPPNEELDISKLQESESESEISAQELSEEEDVALSEVELDDDADVVPYQKVTINNKGALLRSLKRIDLPADAKNNFVEHFSITQKEPIVLRDIYDDTERELAFYKQSLAAAVEARKLARKLKIEFSRPTDYFAEMVKSDEHMTRVRAKLVDQEKSKRAAQEARKQRELKKYGKKVQHEKLQQRAKEKREMLDKITGLKRKRKNADIDQDQFGVEVEDALSDKKKLRDEKFKLGNQRKPNGKRLAKNKKYGSGYKRGDKRNTSESSMDVSGFRNKKQRRK